ncbi:MAG: tyrosine-type recombinase/integrase [Actinobacteria bacterium]|nr:tyrosine-type recombinase/integrase [Actinomycetota bacterium]
MTTAQAIAFPEENLIGWERALYAFLVEKQRRSGSLRTVQGYSSMLQDFFGRIGKAPDKVTAQEVFIWAHGKGVSGKDPSPVTIGARIACLSSFFRFLQRMDIVVSNPCDKLERPRTSTPPARGLSADEVRRLLAVIPSTPQGIRDRAIVLTLVLTGRRRAEVFCMTAGDLSFENGVCFYSYRGKGGKTGRREFPQPALEALSAALGAFGKDLGVMGPADSIWPSPCATDGRGLTSGTFYGRFRRYLQKAGLPPAGLHLLRHTAAKLRRDAGESVEEVSRFLDHSSLAVTTTYLRRLEGQEDRGWGRVAEAIGLSVAG